jgi:hypothetical protein
MKVAILNSLGFKKSGINERKISTGIKKCRYCFRSKGLEGFSILQIYNHRKTGINALNGKAVLYKKVRCRISFELSAYM